MKRLLAVAVLVAGASPCAAEDLELALSAGYTTPGGITAGAAGVQDLQLAGSFTFGASAAWPLSARHAVEVSWARQQSALEIATDAGSAEMFDVHVDQLQGAFVFRFGDAEAALRPFLSAGAGAALFSAPTLDTEAKLSFALGGGLQWRASGRVGVRAQARYTPTYLNDTSSDFCDPFGFCQGWLHQFEMTGGLVVRF
jgi:opacity protein-like surface antigen